MQLVSSNNYCCLVE